MSIKLRSLLEVASVPSVFKKLFAAFPRDAKSWKDATDEMREISKSAREYYNELDLDLTESEVEDEGKGIQSMNFRSFKTPSEWNSKSQDFIVMVFNKMKPGTKNRFIQECKERFPNLF